MSADSPFLVRCAKCKHNFESHRLGKLTCPICKAEVYIEPPDGDQSAALAAEGQEAPDSDEKRTDQGGAESQPEAQAETETPEVGEEPPGGQEDEPVPPDEPQGTPAEPDPEELKRLLQTSQALLEHGKRTFEPAWETRSGSVFRRFAETLKQVFGNPAAFFANLKLEGYRRALTFAWIVCTLAVFFFALYGLWQLSRNSAAMLQDADLASGQDPEELISSMHNSLLITLFGSPLFGLVNVFLSAVLYHLGIMLAANRQVGFAATFRATAYGFAPLILVAIPFIGHLIGGMWSLVVQIIALANVHRISPARASLAVLLPVTGVLLLLYAVS